jgi:hypothetical protein
LQLDDLSEFEGSARSLDNDRSLGVYSGLVAATLLTALLRADVITKVRAVSPFDDFAFNGTFQYRALSEHLETCTTKCCRLLYMHPFAFLTASLSVGS